MQINKIFQQKKMEAVRQCDSGGPETERQRGRERVSVGGKIRDAEINLFSYLITRQ